MFSLLSSRTEQPPYISLEHWYQADVLDAANRPCFYAFPVLVAGSRNGLQAVLPVRRAGGCHLYIVHMRNEFTQGQGGVVSKCSFLPPEGVVASGYVSGGTELFPLSICRLIVNWRKSPKGTTSMDWTTVTLWKLFCFSCKFLFRNKFLFSTQLSEAEVGKQFNSTSGILARTVERSAATFSDCHLMSWQFAFSSSWLCYLVCLISGLISWTLGPLDNILLSEMEDPQDVFGNALPCFQIQWGLCRLNFMRTVLVKREISQNAPNSRRKKDTPWAESWRPSWKMASVMLTALRWRMFALKRLLRFHLMARQRDSAAPPCSVCTCTYTIVAFDTWKNQIMLSCRRFSCQVNCARLNQAYRNAVVSVTLYSETKGN